MTDYAVCYTMLCLVIKHTLCITHKEPTLNPLNAKLNPICHLLALLGAHHILLVSGIRVNLLPWYSSCHRSFITYEACICHFSPTAHLT